MKPRLPTGVDVIDRRVQRTRDALREALMHLMVECGWDAIDVQTLCARANIGRSTFYQHYFNKEELLKANFAVLREILLTQAKTDSTQPEPLGFVYGLVAHVHGAQAVFRALLDRRSGQYVQDRFRELLVELVQSGTPPSRAWQTAARAHYLGGALFEMLAWWLGNNRPQKPEEVSRLFLLWSRAILEMPVA